jgi:hypothetical protein
MNVLHAALSRDFWITGGAIARYLPKAFRTKQIDGNLFFTDQKRQEYRRRVESLTPGSHGFYDLPDESYLISRTLFKWILVDWHPEQPVGLRLPTGFKIPHARRFDFAYEKAQLLKILEADWNARTADAWKPHPMFGKMTPNRVGQALADSHGLSFAAVRSLTKTRKCDSAAAMYRHGQR